MAKRDLLGALKTLVGILQAIMLIVGIAGTILFALYPDFFMSYFMGFIGMPSTLSVEEVIADPDGAMESCADAFIEQMKDSCYYDIAPKMATKFPEKAIEACGNIATETIRGGCYMEVASSIYEKDPERAASICASIETIRGRDGCYYNVFLKSDRVEANPSMALEACSKLSEERDGCYYTVASALMATNPEKAREACGNITGGDRDECYYEIARSQRGVDFDEAVESCRYVKNSYSQFDCFGEVWFRLSDVVKANPDKSIEVCKLVPVEKDECFNAIAGSLRSTNPNKAVEACDGMEDRLDRDNCYREVWLQAQSTVRANPDKSIAICAKLSTNNDECYQNVASALSSVNKEKALEACEKITDPSQKNGCKENYG